MFLKINTGLYFQTHISDKKGLELGWCLGKTYYLSWIVGGFISGPGGFQSQVQGRGGIQVVWPRGNSEPFSPSQLSPVGTPVLEIPLIKNLDLNSTLEDKRSGD